MIPKPLSQPALSFLPHSPRYTRRKNTNTATMNWNIRTVHPSSIPSTSQADTATMSRDITPSEDLDPFQVFGGVMESPTSEGFVLVVTTARTPGTSSR